MNKFKVRCDPSKNSVIIEVQWKSLPNSWYKCNSIGAAKGYPDLVVHIIPSVLQWNFYTFFNVSEMINWITRYGMEEVAFSMTLPIILLMVLPKKWELPLLFALNLLHIFCLLKYLMKVDLISGRNVISWSWLTPLINFFVTVVFFYC